jgi:phosphoglucan,water dikinase
VKLRLRLDHQVNFGETHAFLGSADCTGAWQERVRMSWTESGWVAELQGKSGEQIEFKHMIITGDGSLVWENGPNRHITLQ